MTRRDVVVCAAVVAPLLLGTSAEATTAAALSNLEMTQEADLIVTGRCTELRSEWQGRALVTLATIAPTEVLKGAAADSVTVVLPGGVDANRKFPVAMSYPGAPQISPSEEVFLFLRRQPDGSTTVVVGFSQGKFSIVADEQGRPAVSRNLSQITLAAPGGTVRGTVSRTPLDQFKDEIRGYLR